MEKLFTLERDLARFQKTALGKYLDGFANRLRDEGYRPSTMRYRIRLAASFGEWIETNAIPVESINQQHTIQFFAERKQRPMHHDVPALNQLLELLRNSGTIGRATVVVQKLTAAEKLAEEFAVYLSQERGLSEGATENTTRFVKGFLRDRFADGEARLSSIHIEDVTGFVHRQAIKSKPAQLKKLACSLRAFLRYALYQKYIGIDLAAAVPVVANWSKESLPKSLSNDQVERILSCCDRQTAIGKRDYAILLLLSRLGLRGGALVSLRLEDIDWHSGCIIVRGKGSSLQLPLPSDAGEAIASYLHNGRPRVSSRSVFLRSRAPICGFTESSAISYIVDRALARAGIVVPHRGAHLFRHTLATELLRRGNSLAEIGEVLGHSSLYATTVYAKVDFAALRELALSWPGGAQ